MKGTDQELTPRLDVLHSFQLILHLAAVTALLRMTPSDDATAGPQSKCTIGGRQLRLLD